jgi:hypothetical protein
MIEFNWELTQIPPAIKKGLLEKQIAKFIRPHDAIWGDAADSFVVLAESIYELLPTSEMQRQFLSVCLGSYLLDPRKAPTTVPSWIKKRTSITDLIGIDVSLEELCSWRWDRAAFPVLDEYEKGKNDTIYYALVAKSKTGGHPLYPSWTLDVLNVDALDSVNIASELVGKSHLGCHLFFWPFINPKKPTHDRSLGLPVYLSFLSLAKEKPIPAIIATGEINRLGELHPVQGVLNKWSKAFEKKFKLFIYPEDGSRLEQQREHKPVGVATITQAEYEWGFSKAVNVQLHRVPLEPITFVDDITHIKPKITELNSDDSHLENEVVLPILTKNQTDVVNAILSFMNSTKDCFVLRGSAGTGKTTLLKVLIYKIMESKRACVLLAPTGRAARILGKKTQFSASTIHSAIYTFADVEVFEGGEAINDPGIKLHFNLKTDDPCEALYVVDESSMVADIESNQDDLRFGSGRLLSDLINYIRVGRPGREGSGSKILFVGDPAQLPPINQSFSPALSTHYLQETFHLTCSEFELIEIMRQEAGSAILERATCLRDCIEKQIFNRFDLSSTTDEIIDVSPEKAISMVVEAQRLPGNAAVLITYSNPDALEFNRAVRSHLWGNEKLHVQPRDMLLINKNSIKHGLFNGDLVRVLEVESEIESKTVPVKNSEALKFRKITIAYRTFYDTVMHDNCLIFENLLDSPSRSLSPQEQQALLIDFKIRHPELKNPKTAEFRKALMHDEYFNALHVKYGYAMTCHKAQGGEWDTAIVYFGDSRGRHNKDYFRWVYTAITRAKKKLCTIEAPKFGPLNNFTACDACENSYPPSDIVDPSQEDSDFVKYSFPTDKEFLFDNFKMLRRVLHDAGIHIIDVGHFEFMERYTLRSGGETASLQYNYKKNGTISNMKTAPGQTDSELCRNAIKFIEFALGKEPEEILVERKPFQIELEMKIRTGIENTSFPLTSIIPMEYKDRYTFVFHNKTIQFDFVYNKKQVFTGYMTEVGGSTPSGKELSRILITAIIA